MRIARYAMRKIPLSMTIASRSTTFALKDPSRQTSTLNVSPGYIGPEKRSDTERTAPGAAGCNRLATACDTRPLWMR